MLTPTEIAGRSCRVGSRPPAGDLPRLSEVRRSVLWERRHRAAHGIVRRAGSMNAAQTALTRERADLAETLATHRNFLRRTANDLTDEQAATRPTVSELCIGGIIKHVTAVERSWARFIVDGPSAMASNFQ